MIDLNPSSSSEASVPHAFDIHVGQRVRARRKALGMSQQDLANAIGLTFQQVQKYERGSNRISASKVFAIGKALGVTAHYFFDDYDHGAALAPTDPSGEEAAVNNFLATAEGLELAQNFPKIRPGKLRRKIVELVQALSLENA